jgi:serine/threonine-protein kinase HipA
MQKVEIYRNGILAGLLTKENSDSYIFRYDNLYFTDPDKKAISLTLPKSIKEYRSKTLFPFFCNMLSEGVNKQLQCRQLKIDENDYFGLLIATAQTNTIGTITVKPV